MATDIGPKIGIEGESQFKKQIADINSSLKVLGSEMGIVTAEFGKNAKSEEALTKQNEILERKAIELKDKLDLQTKALIDQVNATDESNERSKQLQIEVNKTTAELAKTERQMAENTQTMADMANETEDAGEEFDDAGKQAASFGDVLKANILGDAITKGLSMIADGVKKVAGALKDAVFDSAAYADELLTMSKTTHLSVETLQELDYASELIDVDLSTVAGSLSKLTKQMSSAKDGTGAAAEAFGKLWVSVTDLHGNLRDNEDVFYDVIDALGRVENETERDAIAMAIFGKSASDLNPLIEAGSVVLSELAEEAHNTGYVLDNDMVESLGGVQDSIDRVNSVSDGLKRQLATALAPTIEDVAGKLQGWIETVDWDAVAQKVQDVVDKIKEFGQFLIDNGPTIISIIAGIAAGFVAWQIASIISGVVGALQALSGATTAATTAQTGLNAAMAANPIGAIISIIAALVAAVVVLWNTNEEFRNWVIQAWTDIKDFTVNTWNAIKNFFVDTWNGIKETCVSTWNEIRENFAQTWQNIKDFFINTWTAIKNFFIDTWNGIKNVWSEVTGFFTRIFQGARDGITNAFSNIGQFFSNLWTNIKNLFSDAWKSFKEVGGNIVEGIWQGISSGFTWIKTKIEGWVGDVLGFFKRLLGIRSPSKVFANVVGKNMALGIGVGFDDALGAVERDMSASMSSLVPTASANIGVRTALSGGAAGNASMLATAIKDALGGAGVYMDGRKVGNLVTNSQNSTAMIRGASPVYA